MDRDGEDQRLVLALADLDAVGIAERGGDKVAEVTKQWFAPTRVLTMWWKEEVGAVAMLDRRLVERRVRNRRA